MPTIGLAAIVLLATWMLPTQADLMSAHMAQHVTLAMVVPPLWIAGLRDGGFCERHSRSIRRLLTQASLTWLIGIVPMVAWHLPATQIASAGSLHFVQMILTPLTAAIFWWPVFTPYQQDRLRPLVAIPYLVTACVACSVIGILITFAPPGLYASSHPIHASHLLSPADDQQLAGLILWVPGCLIYLSAMIASLTRWHRLPDAQLGVTA